ncbi:MAG: hypothetical protein COA67_11005 [Lutibacter sp.]|nr:MAG: hypothetical protein COA67_11005 [Lutibacter sp.]
MELRPNPFLKGEVILKDGTIRNGGIQLNDSAFRIRFKDSAKQKKSVKIDYKTVEKIIINIDSLNPREFYYKKTTKNKFYSFVELLQTGSVDLYKSSRNNLNLFYEGIDRRTTLEWMSHLRNTSPDIANFDNSRTVKLNGQNVILPTPARRNTQFAYIEIEFPVYLLHKKNTKKLFFLYSNKNLKEFTLENLNNCPKLVEKIQSKEFRKRDIAEIVEYYNENCGE